MDILKLQLLDFTPVPLQLRPAQNRYKSKDFIHFKTVAAGAIDQFIGLQK